ncbi:MAG TPA: glucosamine-6-phosphate deaminase [Puia sp.]|jgi:glucosamine-6-phosphate deaminase|nr:glucosamine-6-phosphate deaminase [Puia sp.]
MIKEIPVTKTVDKLEVKIYESRLLMGTSAAYDVSGKVMELLAKQDFVNIVFAAAPSQNEFLAAFSQSKLDWRRINAFHMDEYIGLKKSDPERFGNFLKERIFDRVPFHEVHYLDGNTGDPAKECRDYADLLRRYPTDIVCLGIGENAHLAFNDPHVANFNDPSMVKVVDLAEASRQQQVNDGCFARLEDVPGSALTLTIPALFRAKAVFCIVPGSNKAEAVYHTLHSEITEVYPSTALREHDHAVLYLDKKSAEKI